MGPGDGLVEFGAGTILSVGEPGSLSGPEWLQPLCLVNPAYWTLEGLRAALLEGHGLARLAPILAANVLFGAFGAVAAGGPA